MRSPIALNLAEDGTRADITIRGWVGAGDWYSTVQGVAAQLTDELKEITVRISSLGGLMYQGVAIHNVLKAHSAHKTVIVESVAGSAGSVVAMAGDEIVMYANALMMVHPVRMVQADDWGQEVETPEAKAQAEAWNAVLLETYRARTGKTEDELREMLQDEKWMTAKQAVDAGFADRIEPIAPPRGALQKADALDAAIAAIAAATGVPAAALAMASAEALAATEPETSEGGDPQPEASADDKPADAPQADASGDDPADDPQDAPAEAINATAEAGTFAAQVMTALNAAGLKDYADAFLLDDKLDSVAAVQQAINHAIEVSTLCNAVGAADHLPQLIRSHATPAEARRTIATARADASDALGINGHQPAASRKTPAPQNVWAGAIAKLHHQA